MSYAVDSKLFIPCPDGKEYKPFQKAGIEYATSVKNCLIADDPGLGKTIQAIGVLNFYKETNALIVCPSSAIYNWRNEINEWHVSNPDIEVLSAGQKVFNEKAPIKIVGFGMVAQPKVMQYLNQFKFNYLIVDESHYLKNPTTKRTKAVYGVLGKRVHRMIQLSGTPITNRPMNIWTSINCACPEAIDNMTRFKFGMKFCNGYKGHFGWNFVGASNMKELGVRLRSHYMIRRRKKDVLKDLPDKFLRVVYLEKDTRSKKVIKEIGKIDKEYFLSRKVRKVKIEEDESIATVRKELGLSKIKPAASYIKDVLDSGTKKIVVFAHHRQVLDELRFLLNLYNPCVVMGGLSSEEKQKQVDLFQKDESCRVFLGNIISAGVAITLTAANHLAFVETSYVPAENKQAIDRIHRIGQTKGVIVDFLTFEKSLDETIIKEHFKKMKNIKEVLR